MPVVETPFQRPSSARSRGVSSVAALWIADPPSWAAGRLDPKLEGRAVVVAEGSRVVGANIQARASGVRPGEALERSRGLCPDGVFLAFETSMLEAAWESAISGMDRVTPYLDPVRPGLAFLGGITGLEAEALSAELNARVGLAHSRGTARLAALAALEGRARVVRDDARFLERVPVVYLRGAGLPAWVVERLALFGLKTLGDLTSRVTPKQLAAQFGAFAANLWALSTGADDASVPVYAPPPEVRASFEFEVPALEPGEWTPAFERVVHQATRQLGERLAGNVTVTTRTSLGVSSSRRVFKDFTRESRSIHLVAAQALQGALQPGLELLSLGVMLGGLHHLIPYQDSLFGTLERPHVREAIKHVHRCYPERLGRFAITNPSAYLPERRFQFVPLTGEESSAGAKPSPETKPTKTATAGRSRGKS